MSIRLDPRYFLRSPLIYNTYQKIVGGQRARKLFIHNIVKATKHQKVLDIGCGPGDILEYLPEVNYYGFDVDEDYIDAANKRYKDRGTFTCAAVNEFNLQDQGTFDIVMAIGVIHHLKDDEAESLFRLAKKALKPNGRFITLDGCYVEGQHFLSRFFLKHDRGEFVREQNNYEMLANTSFSNVKSTIEHDYFHIPYTLLIMDCAN